MTEGTGEIMASIIVLLIIIIVVVALLWLMRSRRTPARSRRRLRKAQGQTAATRPGGIDKLKASGLFWGVEIGQPGCEAAQQLTGKQFTFADAPELPLPGCSLPMCTCQFSGLRENRSRHRRKQDDRRNEIRFDKDKPDRRSPKNRRRGDSWNDHTY
jgi:hypothetical protein